MTKTDKIDKKTLDTFVVTAHGSCDVIGDFPCVGSWVGRGGRGRAKINTGSATDTLVCQKSWENREKTEKKRETRDTGMEKTGFGGHVCKKKKGSRDPHTRVTSDLHARMMSLRVLPALVTSSRYDLTRPRM